MKGFHFIKKMNLFYIIIRGANLISVKQKLLRTSEMADLECIIIKLLNMQEDEALAESYGDSVPDNERASIIYRKFIEYVKQHPDKFEIGTADKLSRHIERSSLTDIDPQIMIDPFSYNTLHNHFGL